MKKSFGLIEVLIVTTIFIIFAGALTGLVLTSSKNFVVSRHRLSAANIAREGAELVGEIRDTAWQKGINWSNFGTSANIACWGLNSSPDDKKVAPNYSDSNCDFSHWRLVSGNEAINRNYVDYARKIKIDEPNSDTKRVTVTVSWQDFGHDHQIQIITYLTNWK